MSNKLNQYTQPATDGIRPQEHRPRSLSPASRIRSSTGTAAKVAEAEKAEAEKTALEALDRPAVLSPATTRLLKQMSERFRAAPPIDRTAEPKTLLPSPADDSAITILPNAPFSRCSKARLTSSKAIDRVDDRLDAERIDRLVHPLERRRWPIEIPCTVIRLRRNGTSET